MLAKFPRCTSSTQKVIPPLLAPGPLEARQSISSLCGASVMVNQALLLQDVPSLTSFHAYH
jgi:hypothetical protein